MFESDLYYSRLYNSLIHSYDNDFDIDNTQLFSPVIDFFNRYDLSTVEFDDLEDVKITLTDDEFDKFSVINLNEQELQNFYTKCCCICLENYKLYDSIVIIKCKHIFHKHCIYSWLCNQSVNCPVCRTDNRVSHT